MTFTTLNQGFPVMLIPESVSSNQVIFLKKEEAFIVMLEPWDLIILRPPKRFYFSLT